MFHFLLSFVFLQNNLSSTFLKAYTSNLLDCILSYYLQTHASAMISFLSHCCSLTPRQQGNAGLFQPDLNPPIPQIISNHSAFILLQNLLKKVHGLEKVCLSLKYHFLWPCSSAIMSLLKLISQGLPAIPGKISADWL